MLSAGTRLGPYEIVSRIGAGGMGEVFRARDTRLDRSVAIKVLPSEFASNAQLKQRFEREARSISQLNHPHICTLHDVGSHDGVEYLVMELIEGETLADRVARAPLPLHEVLKYGAQIADALHVAHRAGIVHRDLKPGNIMITKSGAKLLDFGLAKTAPAAILGADEPTQQKPMTAEGTIIGTFQYMAPEQLEGIEADARTDIFALGAILYEMLTGKRAFEGRTRTSLIAAIVGGEPRPISALQPLTPPALEHVIRQCLEKDPVDRWQSAHDVAAELRWIASSPVAASESSRTRGNLRWRAAAAAVLAGAALGAAAMWVASNNRALRQPVARFTVASAADPIVLVPSRVVAISPDGSRVVYRGRRDGKVKLLTRHISQLGASAINGSEGGAAPSFSADGRSILFSSERKLRRVPLDGGDPVVIAEVQQGEGILGSAWHGDNVYYVSGFTRGISVVPAAGGEARVVLRTDPKKGFRALLWPDVTSDGKTLLVTAWGGGEWDDAKIIAHSLETGETRVVVNGGTCARFLPTGHLLYGRGNALYAVPFDARRLQTTGAAVIVVNGVANGVQNGEYHYAVAQNGTLVYIPGSRLEPKRHLVWVDRKGNETLVVPSARAYAEPALAPDGQSIAVTLESSTFDVWRLDVERDAMTRISFGGDDAAAQWTPDGERVLFRSSRSGVNNIYWARADGSTGEERLTTASDEQSPHAVTPDGRTLLFQQGPLSKSDLYTMELEPRGTPRPFVNSPFSEWSGSWSPDGKWLVYRSNESGRYEAYLRSYRGAPGKWLVSSDGADGVAFSPNGREIIYRKGARMYAVPVQLEPRVSIGRPELLWERDGYESGWDISPDGEKILRVKREAVTTADTIVMVLNWFDELNRRVPVP